MRTIGAEQCDHDGEGAALLEEGVGLVEIFCLRTGAFSLNIAVPRSATDPMTLTAEDCGDQDEDRHLPELEVDRVPALCGRAAVPGAGEHAGHEKQRIARRIRNTTPDSTKMTTSSPTSTQVPK